MRLSVLLVAGLILTACSGDGGGEGSAAQPSDDVTASPSVGQQFCTDLQAYSDQLQEDVANNKDVSSLVTAIQQTSGTAADILDREADDLPADAAFDAADVTNAIATLATESDITEIVDDVKAIPAQISTFATKYC